MIENVQGISPLVVTALDAARSAVSDDADSNRLKDAQAQRAAALELQAQTAANNSDEVQTDADATASTTDFSQISDRLQELLNNDTTVKFSVDETTKRVVMSIVDINTQEIVRQIPAEESLRIAQFITENFEQGQVTDAKI